MTLHTHVAAAAGCTGASSDGPLLFNKPYGKQGLRHVVQYLLVTPGGSPSLCSS